MQQDKIYSLGEIELEKLKQLTRIANALEKVAG